MKNIITLITMLSFCSTQTAMFSNAGEEALGVWFSADIYNIEYSDELETDYLYLNIGYKLDSELEFAIDYSDYAERFDIGLSYHIKTYDQGLNLWGKIRVLDVFEDTFDLGEALGFSIGAYTNELIHLTVDHVRVDSWSFYYNYTTIEV